jgi:hypothetical protein
MNPEIKRVAAYLLLASVELERVVDIAREDFNSDIYEHAVEARNTLARATGLMEYITTQTEDA